VVKLGFMIGVDVREMGNETLIFRIEQELLHVEATMEVRP
jgi:hypothetical protein